MLYELLLRPIVNTMHILFHSLFVSPITRFVYMLSPKDLPSLALSLVFLASFPPSSLFLSPLFPSSLSPQAGGLSCLNNINRSLKAGTGKRGTEGLSKADHLILYMPVLDVGYTFVCFLLVYYSQKMRIVCC